MFGITRYTDVFLLSFLMAAFTQIKTVKIGHQVELLLAPNRKRKEELNDSKNIFSQCPHSAVFLLNYASNMSYFSSPSKQK